MNSHDRLFSVDTRTGELVTRFGQGGYAMLREGLRNHDNKTEMRQSSPPVIYKNLVIVGSSIPDRLQYKGDPPVRFRPSTCEPENASGFFTRFRSLVNLETRPGKTIRGR